MLNEILDRFPDLNFVKLESFDQAVVGVVEDRQGLRLLYSLDSVFELIQK